MALVVFAAYDAAGAPLAGLTPTWDSIFDADSEAVIGSPPTLSEIGDGLYKFTAPSEDITGVIDLTGSATPRWLGVSAEEFGTITAYDSSGDPLTGLSPTWDSIVEADATAITPEPTFTELGPGTSGIYKFDFPAITQSQGIIDFGATARPRYVMFSRLAAGAGGAPTPSPLAPRAVDGGHSYRLRT